MTEPAAQPEPAAPVPEDAAPDTTTDPVPVAEQRDAGVAPEDTVTMADQRAGTPPPPEVTVQAQTATADAAALSPGDVPEDVASGDVAPSPDVPPALQPNEAAGTEAEPETLPSGASNTPDTTAQNAQASAARAHGMLTHIEHVIAEIKADIERYVPAPLRHAAETEAVAEVRNLD